LLKGIFTLTISNNSANFVKTIVQILLKAGAIVTKSTTLTKSKSALLHAVEKQQYDIAKLLLQNGASTDDGDSANGWPNSVMMTCQQKNLEMLQLLINYGAIVNTPSYIERNDKHGNAYKVLVHPIFIASQSSDSSFLEVSL
jgi:ankyrin repeat protein